MSNQRRCGDRHSRKELVGDAQEESTQADRRQRSGILESTDQQRVGQENHGLQQVLRDRRNGQLDSIPRDVFAGENKRGGGGLCFGP